MILFEAAASHVLPLLPGVIPAQREILQGLGQLRRARHQIADNHDRASSAAAASDAAAKSTSELRFASRAAPSAAGCASLCSVFSFRRSSSGIAIEPAPACS